MLRFCCFHEALQGEGITSHEILGALLSRCASLCESGAASGTWATRNTIGRQARSFWPRMAASFRLCDDYSRAAICDIHDLHLLCCTTHAATTCTLCSQAKPCHQLQGHDKVLAQLPLAGKPSEEQTWTQKHANCWAALPPPPPV